MSTIYAVDPGPETSAMCVLHNRRIISCEAEVPNFDLMSNLQLPLDDILAIEWMECMGMAVGEEVFRTVYFSGKLSNAWRGRVLLVPRRAVKMHLCGSMKAKDGNVRQALIDMLGAPGKPSAPGPTFGVASHGWSALGIAIVTQSKLRGAPDLECVRWDDEETDLAAAKVQAAAEKAAAREAKEQRASEVETFLRNRIMATLSAGSDRPWSAIDLHGALKAEALKFGATPAGLAAVKRALAGLEVDGRVIREGRCWRLGLGAQLAASQNRP